MSAKCNKVKCNKTMYACTEFLFGMMRNFWTWIVVILVQHCEENTRKNG